MEDTPYLMRGIQTVETESSTLVSSSPYLNEPRLRDWIATHYLRRSGRDLPTTSDAYKLHRILSEVQDMDRIEALFTEERRRSPDLDRWFSDGFVSTYTPEDLLTYPEGSLGYTFGRYLVDNQYQVDIVPRFEPKTQYQYYALRSGQTHDLEHIVCGGGFDILGELIPYYARLSNVPRFLSAELAGMVNAGQLFGSTRIMMRTGLHYQQSYPMALKAAQHGMRVGEASGPIFMARYEDVFHLPIPEARAALGIREAVELDTREASLAWDEYR
ncbi:Coq4 family protein [Sphingomonas jatrophae]|uniref:Ubiquinone biosynthesis protein Coq4 n=1 Tax=Sphingomonas jatrophae TaxID=1166337 RepID=A0A1I6KC09_9SPHN|nr:Coq4 family protein [Sphingomonas jatrophae]SFR88783.1 Ubiquinone biosynthesis protein Coq4 [Sphingomonas jatrophae]